MPSGPDQVRDALDSQPSPDNQGGEQPLPENQGTKTFNRGLFPDGKGKYSPIDPKVLDSIQTKIDSGRKRGKDSPDRKVQTEAQTGFTNPPIYSEEVSIWPLDMSKTKTVNTPTMDKIRKRKIVYNLFEDYSGKQFTHLFDYFSDQKGGLGDPRVIPSPRYENGKIVDFNPNDIYLGSYVKSYDNNEDPTYLGFDLKIKELESPLFNGTAETFINQFAGYGNTEIAARLDILRRFQTQLATFLRTDIDPPQWEDAKEYKDPHGVKTYYMKKITGLNNLVESYDGAEGKQFVEYGKDFITLTFNEDVTQNIGYLAHLYKLLSYSRLNGKLILPPNVLRFDVELEITEVRKMNRYYKSGFIKEGELTSIADKIAKYTYTLYECEFFFPSLPHGDSLDMSNIAIVDDYEVKFNYKWSTSKFTRFSLSSNKDFTNDKLDNKLLRPSQILPFETNQSQAGNQKIDNYPEITPKSVVTITTELETTMPADKKGGDLQAIKEASEKGNNTPPKPTELVTDTTNVTVETPKGTGKSIGEQLSSSSIQKALDSSLIIGPFGGKVKEALAQVNKSITFPEVKGFALGILGGELSKATNDLVGNVSGFEKGFLQGKLNEVNSSIINPIKKGFNLNILGGGLGGSLGSIGNLIGGDNLKSKLNDILSGTIAPKIKGFTTGLLGGGLLKTSGIVENLGLAKNLIDGLNKISSATIAPSTKGFNLGMIGGALTGSSGLTKSLSNTKIIDGLAQLTKSVIEPGNKGFNLNILGGSLTSESGSIAKKVTSNVKENLEKAKNNLIDSGIKTINKSLFSQASLLNKTLGNISSQKNPTQNKIKSQLAKGAVGAARNFVGRSLKSFFTK